MNSADALNASIAPSPPENAGPETQRLAEFAALRDEIVHRMTLRDRALSGALLLFGAFLGIGVQRGVSGLVLLVYPVLALFLACLWAQSDVRIAQLGRYISEHIEPKLSGLGWEGFLRRAYPKGRRSLRIPLDAVRLLEVSSIGIFLTSAGLTWLVGAVRIYSERNPGEGMLGGALLLADLAAMYLTFRIVTQRTRAVIPAESP